MDWIWRHQANRRNLTDARLSEIRGTIYNETKKEHGGQRDGAGRGEESSRQNDDLKTPEPTLPKKTASKVAEEHGVSAKTIERDGHFAKGLELLDAVDADEADAVREYKELKRIEAELAKKRSEANLKRNAATEGATLPSREKPKENSRASEIAAQKVGMGRRTAEKGTKVVEEIDKAKNSGVCIWCAAGVRLVCTRQQFAAVATVLTEHASPSTPRTAATRVAQGPGHCAKESR